MQQAPTYFTPPDPAIGDMLKLSEATIEQLQKAKKDLEAKIVDLENEVISLLNDFFFWNFKLKFQL